MYGRKKTPAQKRSCYKMKPKSPVLRALKGAQDTLQQAILASPAKNINEGEGTPRLGIKKKSTKKNEVEIPRIGMKKKASPNVVPAIGVKKKATPIAKKKCKKCGSPMCMCGPKYKK